MVARSFEALAVERVEVDAVGLVGDEQVEHGPQERQAAALAGEAAHHLRASFDFAERALEQVGRSPPAAVPERVAQMHDERVEIVGELVDERVELLLGVPL